MGNGERSNDPAADTVDGWFDLLVDDDEADAKSAQRAAQAPPAPQAPKALPQAGNLSALNEISNKVTPVMLLPVHHLLPPIEPSQRNTEPRDVWETDVGNELDSFFSVPAANAPPPRPERKSEPDPLPPLMELSDSDGEEFLDFGDSAVNLSAAATLGSAARTSAPQPSPPPPAPELTESTEDAFVDFGPVSPPPTPLAALAQQAPIAQPGSTQPFLVPLEREAALRLPDPTGITTSTPLSESLLNPRSLPPAPAQPEIAHDDFDLSDFDRWGRDAAEEVTPAAGFNVFADAPVFAAPPAADDFTEERTVPRIAEGRAAPAHQAVRTADAPTVVPAPEPPTVVPAPAEASSPPARASFTPPPPPGRWGDSTPPPGAPSATRSSPPMAPGATPWNRPASPSRRPAAQSIHEAPTPVRPPPLPHVHTAVTAPPPLAPSSIPPPSQPAHASFTESPTPPRPMPAVRASPPRATAAVPPAPARPMPTANLSPPRPVPAANLSPPRPMPALAVTPPRPTLATAATPPQAMPAPAVSPPRPTPAVEPPPPRKLLPEQEMHERFDLGDFAGALNTAETILEVDPDDRDATHVAEVCRAKLRAIYVGRLGSLDQVPVLAVSPSEFRWLNLDHRAGFLLSLVDGVSTLEDIVDVSAMPQLEALRTLCHLSTQQIITLRRR